MRGELIEAVRETLNRAGFLVSPPSRLRPMAFDLVARRDDDLLIVKVLTNVDSLDAEVARELRILAKVLDGCAVLVGERASSRELETGVVYARHDVPLVTLGTLEEHLLEGVPPLVYAAPGGFYVNIDGDRLTDLREDRELSLGELADVAGVSRRSISMYEEGMGAMVDVAAELEEFLEAPIVEELDPFAVPRDHEETRVPEAVDGGEAGLEREVFGHMGRMGFQIVPVGRSPFHAISRPRDGAPQEMILTEIGDLTDRVAKRARVLSQLTTITERVGAVFVEDRRTRTEVEGTPLVDREELEEADTTDGILDLILERKETD
jgi:putative transcriptional regulator